MFKKNDDNELSLIQIRFTALLKTALHNKKINYIEKRNNSLKKQNDFEEVEFALHDSKDFVQSIFDADILKTALSVLSERERKIFALHLIDGLSFTEIAERENSSYMSIATVFCRTLKKMREKIRSIDDEF